MSSSSRKLQTRIEMKARIEWLENAFRRAYNAAIEQSEISADLSKALWCLAQANGGEVPVSKEALDALPKTAKLRRRLEVATGNIAFMAVVDDDEPARPILENIGDAVVPGAGA